MQDSLLVAVLVVVVVVEKRCCVTGIMFADFRECDNLTGVAVEAARQQRPNCEFVAYV